VKNDHKYPKTIQGRIAKSNDRIINTPNAEQVNERSTRYQNKPNWIFIGPKGDDKIDYIKYKDEHGQKIDLDATARKGSRPKES
jgi:hypothetical protein